MKEVNQLNKRVQDYGVMSDQEWMSHRTIQMQRAIARAREERGLAVRSVLLSVFGRRGR